MGLFRHDDDNRTRYRLTEKLMSVGDDSWIEDANGERLYKVDGKAMRMRDTMALKDRQGNEVAWIQEPVVHVRDTMDITIGDVHATVKKKMVSIRDKFVVEIADGPTYEATGNLVDHEYEIERDGTTVGWVSKKWFRVRDTYGVEVAEGQKPLIVLAIAICIDAMTRG